MHSSEKAVHYRSSNSYSTLNSLTTQTETIWFVCHGLGYLSKYFITYFKHLEADKNYIIAPQAPSKYYQTSEYKHVGACWLTKENTAIETENIMNYFDAVLETELPKSKTFKFILFGYSQGVSVAMRYLASRKLRCDHLILHSGGIPNELESSDFNFYKGTTSLVYGLNDPYLNEERIVKEKNKALKLFGNSINIRPFEGTHEMKPELLQSLS